MFIEGSIKTTSATCATNEPLRRHVIQKHKSTCWLGSIACVSIDFSALKLYQSCCIEAKHKHIISDSYHTQIHESWFSEILCKRGLTISACLHTDLSPDAFAMKFHCENMPCTVLTCTNFACTELWVSDAYVYAVCIYTKFCATWRQPQPLYIEYISVLWHLRCNTQTDIYYPRSKVETF